MHYALLYEYVPDILERRTPFREEHLALLRKLHARAAEAPGARLVMAGAWQPVDGALLLFRADAPADVEAFVKADPYARNGLVKSWRIREWTVVVGA